MRTIARTILNTPAVEHLRRTQSDRIRLSLHRAGQSVVTDMLQRQARIAATQPSFSERYAQLVDRIHASQETAA